MGDPKDSSDLKRLEERLKAARDKIAGESGRSRFTRDVTTTSGIGVGMRIAAEIVAGLVVGVGIGILLDRWWGTQPWMLILFFILGAGASFMNVIRVAREMDRRAAEEKRAKERKSGDDGPSGQSG